MKDQIVEVMNMSKGDRISLLCKLSVKELLNTIEPDEMIQLSTIQTIRTLNGEIDSVLTDWMENPECDPRN